MGCEASRVRVCGDAKLDSILRFCSRPSTLLLPIPRFNVAVGCFRPKDELPALKAVKTYLQQRPNDRVLLAPRQLKRVPNILSKASSLGLDLVLLTQEHIAGASKNKLQALMDQQVYLLNCYGHLNSIYSYCHCVVIGGTFYDRGQNLLEAALAGAAVLYGPKIAQQRKQADLIAKRGGHQVQSWQDAFVLAAELQSYPQAEVAVNLDQIEAEGGALARQVSQIEYLIFDT